MNLGVNIDHIAVLREARQINDPSITDAIGICKLTNVDQITIHLREDRRHINEKDVKNIIELSASPINLECSINKDIIDIVTKLKPYRATIVPENREEITTEGGLNISKHYKELSNITKRLHDTDIEVSLFIDPNKKSIKLAKELGVDFIELHTGSFANIYAMKNTNLSYTNHSIKALENYTNKELDKLLSKSIKILQKSTKLANKLGLRVAAGHGINYQNIQLIKNIKGIEELNIGQSIIARSVFVGLHKAIEQMQVLLK